MMALASVSTSSLIGVAIACSGNVLISLALTVQKLAHRRQVEELIASRSTSPSESTTANTSRDEPYPPDSPDPRPKLTAIPIVVETDRSPNSSGIKITPRPLDEQNGGAVSLDLVDGEDQGRRSPSPHSRPGHISIPHHHTRIKIKTPSRDDHTRPQKTSGGGEHAEEAGRDEVEEGMYLRSKLWWLGMALITIGEGGNFLSYGFAPASVVAPLGTVALVANCIFAPLILKERFHLRELFGMVLAILGAVTVVWASNDSNPRLDPPGLVNAMKQIPFIVYTILNLAILPVLILLSRSPQWGGRFIGIDVGICALFGGYTVLSTKALSSLLSTIFLKAFEYGVTWGLVVVLVGTSVCQIKYLNKALMRFQSKEVIPTQFVFFSMAAIIGSAVLYQEFRGVAFSRFVNFAFGIATTFFGVHLLTSSTDESDSSDDTSIVDEPPPIRAFSPQRATSSASLNLLIPAASRSTERSPLLIPTSIIPTQIPGHVRRVSDAPSIAPGGTFGRARLSKRTSTSDFAPTLGLNSQAGFLLMATTPPLSSAMPSAMKRERSVSRSQVDAEGQQQAARARRDSLLSR
ncbi:magnesium transporter NIPA-domain-containing protein [Naematelia encephala]|uniref:Magnesium transporter NIPA-domain-containing protein n=1 Tax=Naematelia encephala TaxID=71784 RepID=A0A1Y2BIH9_9TREE|nr:magnesium transporter NIPA-domain-containing protein [Naematelia encephala]